MPVRNGAATLARAAKRIHRQLLGGWGLETGTNDRGNPRSWQRRLADAMDRPHRFACKVSRTTLARVVGVCVISGIFCSCARLRSLPDETLTGPPESAAPLDLPGERLIEWRRFYFYEDASVLMQRSYTGVWEGGSAIRGDGLVLELDEGARLQDTTAHPQHHRFWLKIPADSAPGAVVPIRSADAARDDSWRWDSWWFGPMKLGEFSLVGMRGYDTLECRYQGRPLGSVRILERTADRIAIHLEADIPIRLPMARFVYQLRIDRDYILERKDPIEEMAQKLQRARPEAQTKWLKRLDAANRRLVLERLGRKPHD